MAVSSYGHMSRQDNRLAGAGSKDSTGALGSLRHRWVLCPRGREKPVYIGLGTVVVIIVIVAVVMMLRRR